MKALKIQYTYVYKDLVVKEKIASNNSINALDLFKSLSNGCQVHLKKVLLLSTHRCTVLFG